MILVLEQPIGEDAVVVGLYSNLQTAVDMVMHEEQGRGAAQEDLTSFRESVRQAVEQEHGAPAWDFFVENPFVVDDSDLVFKSIEVTA